MERLIDIGDVVADQTECVCGVAIGLTGSEQACSLVEKAFDAVFAVSGNFADLLDMAHEILQDRVRIG